MVVHAALGTRAALLGLLSTLAFGCSRGKSEAPLVADTAAALPASAAPAASAPSGPAPVVSFDPCLVGKWKSTKATLRVDQVQGEGGENVKLEIAPDGQSTIDFTEMTHIKAAMPAFKFDFRYSGKASAKLVHPSAGVLEANTADWGGLRVTATANLPGLGKMPLVKDTPVSQLAALGKGAADALGAEAEKPEEPAPPAPQGIDASPVLSHSSYTCSPSELKITSKQTAGATWLFAKQPR